MFYMYTVVTLRGIQNRVLNIKNSFAVIFSSHFFCKFMTIYFLRPVDLYLGMYSTICMCLHSLFHMCDKHLQACLFKLIKPQLYGRKLGYVE